MQQIENTQNEVNKLKNKNISIYSVSFKALRDGETVIVSIPPLEDGCYIIHFGIQPCGASKITEGVPYFTVSMRDTSNGNIINLLGHSIINIPIAKTWDSINIVTSIFTNYNMLYNIECIFTNHMGISTDTMYNSLASIRLIKIN